MTDTGGQPTAWRSADSAPKDGTQIVVWREDAGVLIAHFVAPSEVTESDDDEPAWWTIDGDELATDAFTHWMYLPATERETSDKTDTHRTRSTCRVRSLPSRFEEGNQ